MERKNIHKNIKELFGGRYDYIVPLYQRNFAWGEIEITQLLQDIYESYQAQHPYFVGSIIVLNRNNGSNHKLEVIDGQQRLTILTLILKILGKDYLPNHMATRLEYDSRDEVTAFLNTIDINSFNKENSGETIKSFKVAISTIEDCPLDAERESLTISKLRKYPKTLKLFADYIATQVFFVLAEMPFDTDVAAYFEIMNNSGEQLKKHEILKALILSSVQDYLSLEEMKSLAIVWDACSQMEKRVQRSIPANHRHLIFGDAFDSFLSKNITQLVPSSGISENKKLSIESIIEDDTFRQKETEPSPNEDDTDNIGEAIIDFPNFLMHVFRLCYNNKYKEIVGPDKDIPLNEKDLLDVYRTLSKDIDGEKFIAQLLYYRIILDRYIIRTDANEENSKWVLKRPHKSSSNNGVWFGKTFGKNNNEYSDAEDAITHTEDNAIKALSMLQVSYPQRKYKRYLNEILSWFEYDNVQYSLNWYIPKLNGLILTHLDDIVETYGKDLYSLGTSTPRFVLNAIDYLMYMSNPEVNTNFEFKYYNSVEHHRPQSRESYGNKYNRRTIDSIGNLYLLSRRVNSSLNAGDPYEKTEKFASLIPTMPPNRRMIYERTRDTRKWETEEIEAHEEEIIAILEKREELLSQFALDEGLLLYRACLAVTDYCAWNGSSGGGGRYSFSNLATEDAKRALAEVSKWQGKHLDLTLDAFIQDQLASNEELNHDSWRKCFVKYSSVTEYCANGNFSWVKDGAIIYLLPQDRIGNWAHELRAHIIHEKATQNGISAGIDRYGLWFSLESIPLLEAFPNADLSFHVWVNEDATKWCYELFSGRKANAKENLFLSSNGWVKNEEGNFYIDGREYLCDCPINYEASIELAFQEIQKMLELIHQIN